MGLTPSGGGNGGGGISGGGEIRLQPPQHCSTVYCDQENYGPLSDGETEAGTKFGNRMVGTGNFGFGGDADGGLGGGTYGGGGGDGQDGDGDGRLIKWYGTVSKKTLGTEPNAPLAYVTGLEPNHPIMSTLGAHGVHLYIDRYSMCLLISIVFVNKL